MKVRGVLQNLILYRVYSRLRVFGLGADIASFLAFYGAVFDGNILSLSPGYSIGGPSKLNQQVLGGGGILGTPQGLSGSHNKSVPRHAFFSMLLTTVQV